MGRRGILLLLLFVASLGGLVLVQREKAVAPGETVSPVWYGSTPWRTDNGADIAVRLQAGNEDGSAGRLLGFSSLPAGATPTAAVTFYAHDTELSSVKVALSHRC